MELPVLNMAGETISQIDLPDRIFRAPINIGLMHQALQRQLANARQGTHDTQDRSEVSRSGAKLFRQKGTGRARQGSRKAPHWKGGGVAHGPHPRSYHQDMPRKMRRAALRSALSVKARDNQVVVVDNLMMEVPRTQEMALVLDRLAGGTSKLVLLPERNEPVEKSARNLVDVKTLRASYLNIRDLLGYDMLVVPLGALDVIQTILG